MSKKQVNQDTQDGKGGFGPRHCTAKPGDEEPMDQKREAESEQPHGEEA
jgi:hypothetical protein